ncbi:DHA2 family efflux MFS transporter permease subunit [Aquabacterium sp. A7-Y]|uniref:DHA2 family efflux MFS transporter permease subunit n=1 Tax=Aquabacterium sp. A7-Y TaxID=1349605 RepID=UPI00223E0C48|nr:DHA2 family efflux MFS transporter permease subunit [Aquabacterium sp. A7-Y]MCW7536916.1 DHA2 family efflux MFS transporter permease subunit [Aquabacterium sp. A7-Y]
MDAPTALPAATPVRAGTSPWSTFRIASLAVFLVSLDNTMLFAAFGALRQAFPGVAAAELSWVLNAYTVVFAAMLIPAGGLADAHGRKRVFMAGVSLFVIASAACGLANSVAVLIAARVLQAVGAALLTPASLSIVLAAFPQNRRAVVVSLWGAVSGLAAAVGPSLGSFVVDTVGWRWAFLINLPIGAIALWRAAAVIPTFAPTGARPRLDWIGMALLILGVGALALGIVQSESPDWSRGRIALAIGLGIAALLAFVAWARRVSAPLIDLRLFETPTYRWSNIATLAFGTAFAMMFFAVFFYLTGIWHYSLPRAGLAITPGPLLVIPTAIVTGRLAARHGHRPFLVGGAVVYAFSGLWYLTVPGLEPAYLTQWLPGLLMSGLGVGLVLPSLSAAAVSRLPAAHFAVGSAVNQATRQIGMVLGVAVTVLQLGQAELQRADFDPLYTLQIVLAIITGACCLPVDTRPRAA